VYSEGEDSKAVYIVLKGNFKVSIMFLQFQKTVFFEINVFSSSESSYFPKKISAQRSFMRSSQEKMTSAKNAWKTRA